MLFINPNQSPCSFYGKHTLNVYPLSAMFDGQGKYKEGTYIIRAKDTDTDILQYVRLRMLAPISPTTAMANYKGKGVKVYDLINRVFVGLDELLSPKKPAPITEPTENLAHGKRVLTKEQKLKRSKMRREADAKSVVPVVELVVEPKVEELIEPKIEEIPGVTPVVDEPVVEIEPEVDEETDVDEETGVDDETENEDEEIEVDDVETEEELEEELKPEVKKSSRRKVVDEPEVKKASARKKKSAGGKKKSSGSAKSKKTKK